MPCGVCYAVQGSAVLGCDVAMHIKYYLMYDLIYDSVERDRTDLNRSHFRRIERGAKGGDASFGHCAASTPKAHFRPLKRSSDAPIISSNPAIRHHIYGHCAAFSAAPLLTNSAQPT